MDFRGDPKAKPKTPKNFYRAFSPALCILPHREDDSSHRSSAVLPLYRADLSEKASP